MSEVTAIVEPVEPAAQLPAVPRQLPSWHQHAGEDLIHKDRWLVSYADFMTLLFAFFVVMYAVSSVNNEKYRVLGQTLEAVFSVPLSRAPKNAGATVASTGIADGGDTAIEILDHASEVDPGDRYRATEPSLVEQNLDGFIDDTLVEVAANQEWLEISLNGSLAFTSGSARLTSAARQALDAIASFLEPIPAAVTVEGFADSVVSEQTPGSNWGLSGARAGGVAAYLESRGVDRERLSAVGYGENHPRRSNATPAGRAANRRVVIVLARRGNQARNLNSTGFQSTPFGAAHAFVRQAEPLSAQPAPEAQRTDAGGLLFTNEVSTGTELTPPTEEASP
ncbi:MAG: OmpA family protein [Pseudomonadota bacterium]